MSHIISFGPICDVVVEGGSSHRDWSETANSSHVSFLQQAEKQVLFYLGFGHNLKEEDQSPPYS